AEANGVTALERAKPEGLREGRLTDAGLPAKKDVLAATNEVERRMELVEELAIDRARMVPVEAIERLRRSERGYLGAPSEVSDLALGLLECAELLGDLCGGSLGLRGVNEPSLDRLA